MKVIRLTIRCSKNPEKHAKLVRFPDASEQVLHFGAASFPREWVESYAQLLCGTSPLYVFPPGPNSPIGKCGVCGATGLTYAIKEADVAEPEK